LRFSPFPPFVAALLSVATVFAWVAVAAVEARALGARVDVVFVEDVVLADEVVFPLDELLELLRVDELALFDAVLLRVPLDLLSALSVIYIPR